MLIIKKALLTCVLFSHANFCVSQIVGKCTDTLGNPIPYMNISVKKSIVGTVTNDKGIFEFEENLLHENDSLVFSHIEYKTQTIRFNKKDIINVVLQPSEYLLKGVEVSASKYAFKNEKTIGTKVEDDKVVLIHPNDQLGTELGKLIQVKKGKKYKVEKVFFNISEFEFKKATFRINFYNEVEQKNIERVRINYNDIIKEVFNNGQVSIDVADENLIFENDFLVSIEWIDYIDIENFPKDLKKEKNICFNSWVFCGPVYQRDNNISNWYKAYYKYNLGLGIYLKVKY